MAKKKYIIKSKHCLCRLCIEKQLDKDRLKVSEKKQKKFIEDNDYEGLTKMKINR
jgi:hypothetical protein